MRTAFECLLLLALIACAILAPQAKKLLGAAFAQGAYFTSKAEECDLYICFEGEGGPRMKSVKGQVLTAAEFSAYLGVEE